MQGHLAGVLRLDTHGVGPLLFFLDGALSFANRNAGWSAPGKQIPPKSPASRYEHLKARAGDNQSSPANIQVSRKSYSSASRKLTRVQLWARSIHDLFFATPSPVRRLVIIPE